jgi:hypothetical protein
MHKPPNSKFIDEICWSADSSSALSPRTAGFGQLQRNVRGCDPQRQLHVESRQLRANTGHCPRARRMGQVDPEVPFQIGPMSAGKREKAVFGRRRRLWHSRSSCFLDNIKRGRPSLRFSVRRDGVDQQLRPRYAELRMISRASRRSAEFLLAPSAMPCINRSRLRVAS